MSENEPKYKIPATARKLYLMALFFMALFAIGWMAPMWIPGYMPHTATYTVSVTVLAIAAFIFSMWGEHCEMDELLKQMNEKETAILNGLKRLEEIQGGKT